MKTLATAALLFAIGLTPAVSQPAPSSGVGPVCLHPFSENDAIVRTKVVDPSTILFYMRDGKIWQNKLKTPCQGLAFHGFSFVTPEDDVCGNSQGISVIETGEVCTLGPFTPYAPAGSAAP